MNDRYVRTRLAVVAATVLLGTTCGGFTALAAPAANPAGTGDGVAIGTGSWAPKAENVAIGAGTRIEYYGGVGQPSTGDIVIGGDAHTNNYADQGGGIAIGHKAFAENPVGSQELAYDFGQSGMTASGTAGPHPENMVTGIAIGKDAYTRSGSVMVSTHNYRGNIGDITVDTGSVANMRNYNIKTDATTVGTNSFNNASFGVVNGAYSAITGKDYSKNFGATITGSLNSIESETVANNDAGVANSIVGLANRTHNTNGSLIFGAGNEITNSIGSLSAPSGGAPSPKDLADTLRTAVQNADGGGSTLAMGMGNKADYTLGSQLSGVNNTLKGTSAASVSKYNLLNGYKNTGTDVNHVSVVGSENTISNTDNAIVMGDKRTLTNANGSIILGSGNSALTTSVGNAVSVGYNANVLQAGGVAIGANSVASVAAGAVGYDPHTGGVSSNSSSTWKATDAAVSVGNGTTVTRQITGVAAGTNDTDAVNVAQLKRVIAGTTIVDNTLVNRLGNRVNRVGAGAAALAALHPLAFDPDYKWDFAAGYGNYAGANAMAVGAYYRPNEDIMFSMGGSFGGGENMMNAGVSFKLGQGTHVKRSASELSKEVEELKAIVKAQSEEIQALRANQEALAQAVAIQK